MVSQAKGFEFSAYRFDKENKKLVFNYQVLLDNGQRLNFSEKIFLPSDLPFAGNIPIQLLDNLLQSLHLILGISYFKLFCPDKIVIKKFMLSKSQAQFWNIVYTKGLGEFFFRNQIKNFNRLINFPYKDGVKNNPISFLRQNRSLVAVGGGKDSIINLELLIKHQSIISGFVVETNQDYPVINQVVSKAGIKAIKITRQIDKKLFNIGKSHRVFRGHVPISAIYAFLGILAAIFYDFRYLIVANEKSADEANVRFNGQLINHQWSKTSEFELLFQDYVNSYLTPDVSYFSLLRPWYELRIAQEFAYYPKYWPIFSSCNGNFSLTPSSPQNRWCGNCPKCASVFLLLASFIDKQNLLRIFGKNLLADENLIPLYKQLLGLAGIKPFECVATIEESRLALYLVWQKKEYLNSPLVNLFEKEVLPMLGEVEVLKKKILSTGNLDNVPDQFKLLLTKKVLILGYGKEGRVTEKFLKAKCPSVKIEIADKTISSDYLEKQKDFDLVIKTPGIPRRKVTSPYTTATNIFFASINNLVIGVTGSKGKSTTASLIYHILKTANIPVRLIGNIGYPALEALLKPVGKNDIFVMELSSYQLDDIHYSPQIAVITNLFPEHMNYHGDVKKYFLAKKNILRFQKPTDYFIYNPENKILRQWSKEAVAQCKPFDRLIKIDPKDIPLSGKHNLNNLKAAVSVAHLLKINDQIITSAISSFKPLPHRLEFVGVFKGIKFYDDAASTAPESTIAAIESLKNIGTIFLGGEDRGYDFDLLGKILSQNRIPNIVLFPDTGGKINKLIAKQTKYQPKILQTTSMEEAIKFAYQHTPKNAVCLLSTASPSYSLWKNYEEKGSLFNKFVKKYSSL